MKADFLVCFFFFCTCFEQYKSSNVLHLGELDSISKLFCILFSKNSLQRSFLYINIKIESDRKPILCPNTFFVKVNFICKMW